MMVEGSLLHEQMHCQGYHPCQLCCSLEEKIQWKLFREKAFLARDFCKALHGACIMWKVITIKKSLYWVMRQVMKLNYSSKPNLVG